MSKRTLIVVLVAAAFLATGFVAVSDSNGWWRHRHWGWGKIPINWKVSGSVANVQFWVIPPVTDPEYPLPQTQLGILIQAVIKGSPGNGQFTVIAIGGDPGLLDECNGGFGQTIAYDDMVIILADMSMIFAEMESGWICFNADGTVTAEAHMIITGGTGKYKDASGNFTGVFEGFPFGTPDRPSALQAEIGTIVGHIER